MVDLKKLPPHRIVLVLIAIAIVLLAAINMQWDWIEEYSSDIIAGLGRTIMLLVLTCVAGFILCVPIGLVQVIGPRPLALLARGFCTVIRGTPLLLQVWIIYYGFGSLFPSIPGVRDSWIWPFLTEPWLYAFAALTISFAGYEGEIMRGAFAGVPKGELEAGRAMGMHPFTILRRIWLPRAVQRVLPTLNGELILQLKATPLVATITVVDTYAVFARIRQETYIIYEPLLLLALTYLIMVGIITFGFSILKNKLEASG